MSANFQKLFTQPVSSLMTKRELLTIEADEKPLQAFAKIVDFGVQSAPVKGSTGKFAGFLCLRDLIDLTVLASQLKQDEKKHSDDHPTSKFLRVALSHANVEAAHWVDKPHTSETDFDVNFSVQYLAKRNPFVAVTPNDPVSKVCALLTRKDVHRVPVVDENGKLLDIISQSNVIAFLQGNMESIKTEFSAAVDDTALGSSPVICVKETDPAINAYKLMKEHDVSGVAIVEAKSGRLQGCISGSDLKLYLKKPSFGYLNKPAGTFIKEIRQMDFADTKYPAVSITQTDTLEKVVGKLAATHLHRVFVTKDFESFTPLSVISLTDVCRFITSQL